MHLANKESRAEVEGAIKRPSENLTHRLTLEDYIDFRVWLRSFSTKF